MRYPIILFAVVVLSLQSCGQKHQTSSKNSETTKTDSTMDIPVKKTEEEWKKTLTSDQYYVLREKGTERAFTGKLLLTKDKGIYRCAACGNELFASDMKFDSHCGWPCFDREIKGGKIITHTDTSFGMVRTEIMCARCGSHLGHIFDDGPTETGKRYCVNSVSLDFVPADSTEAKK